MNCPNCRTVNPEAAKFCMNCGSRLVTENERAGKKSQFRLDRYLPQELITKLEAARTHNTLVGERRVITMLFCDVKGSTAAAEKVDPEVWTDIMNGVFEHMIRPIYKYEGLVSRLMGDAILAFFGAPITHEDDPQRAVLASLEIQEGIKPYAESIHIKQSHSPRSNVTSTGMVKNSGFAAEVDVTRVRVSSGMRTTRNNR